jgi:hypothetical protein
MINVNNKIQLENTNAKVGQLAYCTENATIYKCVDVQPSQTIVNANFIIHNTTDDIWWVAFVGENVITPPLTVNQTGDAIAELSSTSIIEKEPTGFRYPDNVIVTYNSTTRKVTLTGDTECYLNGKLVTTVYVKNGMNEYVEFGTLQSGFVSPVHTDSEGVYFCYICYEDNKPVLYFNNIAWDFSCIQISVIQYKTNSTGTYTNGSIALHETHGLYMNHQTHSHLHKSIGTFRDSGGGIGGVTVNPTISYTPSDRTPTIEQTVLIDEDVKTTLPIHNSKNNYTLRYLTGNSQYAPTKNYITGATNIVQLNGNTPYVNSWNGSTWTQTLMTNNQYACVFIVAVPTASDTESQTFRYLFVQPQIASTSISTIQALTPNNLIHGDSQFLLTEYCFIGKIIFRYVGGGTYNWHIQSTELITGNRSSQISITGGSGFLTSILLDSNDFDGNGISSTIGLKNFNDTKQYVNVDGTWSEMVGGSSAITPTVTATGITLSTQTHVFNTNTTTITHILPLASENSGKTFYIKNLTSNLTYIIRSGSDLIDGLTSIVLPTQYSYIEIMSANNTWNIIRESY